MIETDMIVLTPEDRGHIEAGAERDNVLLVSLSSIAAVEPYYYQAYRTAMVSSLGSCITLKRGDTEALLVTESPARIRDIIEGMMREGKDS